MTFRCLSFFITTLLIGCDSGTSAADGQDTLVDPAKIEIYPIPIAGGDSSICDDPYPSSGGDLDQMVDRIFVGTVVDVSVVEDGLSENCHPTMYEWTLQVTFEVHDNIKGEGKNEVVFINPQRVRWNSEPVYNYEGVWLPERSQPPTIEVSETLGWTREFAVQPGQRLLILGKRSDGFVFTAGMPWGFEDGDGFRLQDTEGCMELPVVLQERFTIETLRDELLKPALAPGNSFIQTGFHTTSSCRAVTHLPPVEDVSDAGLTD